jgi:nitric oxide reductase subunit B
MSVSKLKWVAVLSFLTSMFFLIWGGFYTREHLPPYPEKVATTERELLFQKADIMAGQQVFQKYGLMDHGSIWGHGSQRGPEFTATSLHILSDAMRKSIVHRTYQKPYESLNDLEKDIVQLTVARELRTNRYDSGSGVLTLTPAQVAGLNAVHGHWSDVFKNGRQNQGFLPDTVPTDEERLQISRFFFWTAWVASTNRPHKDFTYTNNWPADRTIGNLPTLDTYLWSLAGILSLVIVLGIFIFCIHYFGIWYGPTRGARLADKLIDLPLTPSQFTAAKYFLVVILLFLLQTTFGGLLAHYTIHPASFWIPTIAGLIPYSWAKTWHLQLAIFWIATTWVGTAVYLAPIIGGVEPKKQNALVKALLAALLFVAGGSLLGEIAGIKGFLGDWWFWLGHQGWEFLELGRIWQILLFAGLISWLLIVYRPIGHHINLRHKDEYTSLIWFYLISAILIVAFFGFGLFYGRESHISMADYWRWFVVHLWVENIFEFFGIAIIALLLVTMGLASARAALMVAYFTVSIVFLSGIIGTAHHFFWFGQPSFWLSVGSIFSSFEPIPLFGLVVRGLMEYRSIRKEGKEFPYRWPLFFLVASSFWSFLGAAVFGFLINLPIINYYEHGTYLTMNHGHGALFGVYGMLSIGLLLFSWRGLVEKKYWRNGLLKLSFFGFNAGLLLLTLGTLFPVGILQTWTAYKEGLWVARDASFFEGSAVLWLGTFRIIPDLTIILLGVVPLAVFLFMTYPRLKTREIKEGESVWERLGVEL